MWLWSILRYWCSVGYIRSRDFGFGRTGHRWFLARSLGLGLLQFGFVFLDGLAIIFRGGAHLGWGHIIVLIGFVLLRFWLACRWSWLRHRWFRGRYGDFLLRRRIFFLIIARRDCCHFLAFGVDSLFAKKDNINYATNNKSKGKTIYVESFLESSMYNTLTFSL